MLEVKLGCIAFPEGQSQASISLHSDKLCLELGCAPCQTGANWQHKRTPTGHSVNSCPMATGVLFHRGHWGMWPALVSLATMKGITWEHGSNSETQRPF